MPIDDYIKALKAYLYLLFYNNRLALPGEKKVLKPNKEGDIAKYTNYLNALVSRVRVEGIGDGSPYYQEIMSYAGPLLQAKQQGLMEEQAFEKQLAERGMALAEQKFATSEAWKQWEAETGETWRKYGAEVEAAKFQWQQQQANRQWEMTQAQAGMERDRAIAAQFYSGIWKPEGERGDSDKAQMWGQMKQELLSQFDPRRDWIKIWQLQNAPNPYAPKDLSMRQELAGAEENLERYERSAQRIIKRMKDPNDPLTVYNVANPQTTSEQMAAIILQGVHTAREQVTEFEEQAAIESGIARKRPEPLPSQQQRPTTPQTPQWLGAMYPEMGGRLSKVEVAPPGAQAFQRLSPSQQQGWMGFAEYAGYDPQDLLAKTQRMIPREPWSRPGGRWAPAQQRA